MPSIKARLVYWVICWRDKSKWGSAESIHASIAASRKAKVHQPPSSLHDRFTVTERAYDGCPVYTVTSTAAATPPRARIMYLHGGAFVHEITPYHWAFVGKLAERLHAEVTVPIYPLGPESTLRQIYAWLQPLHDEMAAADVGSPFWIVGDSAGGEMGIVLSQCAVRAGTPVAGRLVPITPCVDSTMRNPDAREIARTTDPWLDVPGVIEIAKLICPDIEVDDPLASPLYGEAEGLPPMLVFAAEYDLLSPDTRLFVKKAEEAGRSVELIEGKEMIHVWPIIPIPEAEVATTQIVEWLEASLE